MVERLSDLLWFKFTDKGHLVVVAGSFDINRDNSTSCGILVDELEEAFNTYFLFVFPLTWQLVREKAEQDGFYREYTVAELTVGNYLIDKGVPIIDYYSHMEYKFD